MPLADRLAAKKEELERNSKEQDYLNYINQSLREDLSERTEWFPRKNTLSGSAYDLHFVEKENY